MLSSSKVTHDAIWTEIKKDLSRLVDEKTIENKETTRVLILAGTHGSADSQSALSNSDVRFVDHTARKALEFFRKEIRFLNSDNVGVDACLSRMHFKVFDMQDYRKRVTRQSLNDPAFSLSTNTKHAEGKEIKLVEDIKEFHPNILVIGWCFSQIGDVSLLLRSEAIFAKMVMEHDLR